MKKFLVTACLAVASTSVVAEIDPIVIIGDRYAVAASDATQSIQVITAKDIEESGANSVGEALKNLASVSLSDSQGNGNATSAALRGVTNDSAQNVVILVNGTMVDFPTKEGNRIDLINIDQVEQIEVMSGSAGVLYGDGATAGAINIVTRTRQNNDRIRVSAGSFGLASIDLSGSRKSDDSSFLYSITSNQKDGYRYFTETQRDSANLLFETDLGALRSKTLLNAGTEERYTQGTTEASNIITDRRSGGQLDIFDYDRFGISQTLSFDGPRGLTSLGIAHQSSDQEQLTLRYNSGTSVSVNGNQETERDDLNLTHQVNGVDYDAVVGLQKSRTKFYVSYNPSDRFARTEAAFVRGSKTIGDTRISGGVRSEQTKQEKDGARTYSNSAWELGLSRPVSQSVSVRARLDTHFRTPTIDEYEGAGPLKSQTGRSAELGMTLSKPNYLLDISAFRIDYSNEISYTQAVGQTYFNSINLDSSSRQGFSVVSKVDLSDQTNAQVTLNLLDTEFSDGEISGKKIPMAPRVTIAGQLTKRFAKLGTLATLGVRYEGERHLISDYNNVLPPLDEFVEFDTNFVKALGSDTDLTVAIKNLLDHERYAYGVNTSNTGYYIPNEGRTFEVGLTHRF